jgi:hypothetical protein
VHSILLAILEGLAGLTAVTLYLFRRTESEFLWFSIFLLGSAANRCFETYTVFHASGPNVRDLVLNLFELPLGLSAESTYTEAAFEFPAGDQLTILTDGVVEARNANADLFGFEPYPGDSKRTAPCCAILWPGRRHHGPRAR